MQTDNPQMRSLAQITSRDIQCAISILKLAEEDIKHLINQALPFLNPKSIPLTHIVEMNDIPLLQTMLTLGADINGIWDNDCDPLFGYTPLLYAIQKKQPELALFLIETLSFVFSISITSDEGNGGTEGLD
jgi:hypothetical protein